ncbi:hypothetical protein [Streptomyces microflavus]|uniref:hypothetical protein n=1 Tax=Streptomyces microflavus TaxID=1919 RepID=UPI0033C60A9D
MNSAMRLSGRIGPNALLITTAAVPLTGWAVHAVTLYKQIAAKEKDPLTGTWRREAFTDRARRILDRHPDEVVLVLADADHVDRAKNEKLRVSRSALISGPVRVMQPFEGGAACLHPMRSPGTSSRSALPAGGG